jgi:hypothetical protein
MVTFWSDLDAGNVYKLWIRAYMYFWMSYSSLGYIRTTPREKCLNNKSSAHKMNQIKEDEKGGVRSKHSKDLLMNLK